MNARDSVTWMTLCLVAFLIGMAPIGVAEEPKATGDPYALDTCPVSGQKLGSMGDPVVKVYDGREVRFCCDSCPKTFEGDTKKHTEEIDRAIAKQQKPLYPLDTCIMTGEKLDSMGGPVDYVHNNRLVRFCCNSCVKKFAENSEKELSKLDKAIIEKQSEDYPLDTCPISGGKLGGMGEPVDIVMANRLVRLCCKHCIKSLQKEPVKNLSKLDAAYKSKKPTPAEGSHSGN